MREPKRLLTQGATDFERQLLRAVVNERPSALLRSRMQRGLGLVGPLAWASNVKAMFSTLASKATVSVAVGSVVVSGMVAAGGIAAVSLAPGSSARWEAPASDTAASDTAASNTAEVEQAEGARLVAEPSVAEPVTPKLAEPPAEALTVDALARAEADSHLREEIALLDAARAALQGGSRSRARASLDAYKARFPRGILSREAKILRRQAASRSGRVSSN